MVTVPSTMAHIASTCFLSSSGDSGLQTWGPSSFPGGLLLPRGEGRGFLDTQPLWSPLTSPPLSPHPVKALSRPMLRSGRVWGCQSSPLARQPGPAESPAAGTLPAEPHQTEEGSRAPRQLIAAQLLCVAGSVSAVDGLSFSRAGCLSLHSRTLVSRRIRVSCPCPAGFHFE